MEGSFVIFSADQKSATEAVQVNIGCWSEHAELMTALHDCKNTNLLSLRMNRTFPESKKHNRQRDFYQPAWPFKFFSTCACFWRPHVNDHETLNPIQRFSFTAQAPMQKVDKNRLQTSWNSFIFSLVWYEGPPLDREQVVPLEGSLVNYAWWMPCQAPSCRNLITLNISTSTPERNGSRHWGIVLLDSGSW